MHKPVYIAAYHQSEFGKLMGMTVPEIIKASVERACARRSRRTRPSSTSGRWAPRAPTR